MRRLIGVTSTILLLILTGCQSPSGRQAPPEISQDLPPTAVISATVATLPPDPTPAIEDVAPPAQPSEVSAPTAAAEVSAEAAKRPTLFPGEWGNRDSYVGGLIPEEVQVLKSFPDATTYHLQLDISEPYLVKGKMEALYTNQETDPLQELVLHMFPELLGGDMEVGAVLVDGQEPQYQADQGILRIFLEEPLAPGEDVMLSLSFATTVPGEESTKYGVLANTENILALAHFYPMFAVYDDQGWHTEPSADHGDETFADMSFYQVQVEAPLDQVLVAGGVEINRQVMDDRQQVTFAAGPARDFYLVSSSDFDVVQRQIGPLTINSYAPSDRSEGAQMALEVTAQAVESYAGRYGAYPYSELDIVSTPTKALGIEYPGIFANALRIYDLAEESASSGLPNSMLLESTTAHEAAHQWFYNLVGNDQLQEPWLDEALTQYATWQYYIDRYGEQNARGFFSGLEGRWARAENPDMPIGLAADAYSGRDYGAIVYGRGPLFLNDLAELIGQETFDSFLGDYAQRYRWQIADAQGFMELAEEHCNCDLSALFAEEVFGS